MNVSLTPELEKLVNEHVRSGMYHTASEVVREALRLLKQRDEDQAALRADVMAGLEQLDRVAGHRLDKRGGAALAAAVKKRGRARLARDG